MEKGKLERIFSSLTKREGERKENTLQKRVFYYKDGKLVGGYKLSSRWSVVDSIGWRLGFRPEIIHVSTREVNLFSDPQIFSKIWDDVKKATGLRNEDLLPIQPAWFFEQGLGINFLVRKPGSPTFKDVGLKGAEIFYRSGKDLWKTPISKTKTVRVLVFDAPDGHEDGHMWAVKNKVEGFYLVRGLRKGNEGVSFLKGRVISSRNSNVFLPETLNLEGVDIVTSVHNVKWAKLKPGIYNFDIQVVSKEDEDQQQEEKYGLTLATKLLAKIRPEYKQFIDELFKTAAVKACRKAQNILSLEDILEEEEDEGEDFSLIKKDQRIKQSLGLLSPKGVASLKEATLKAAKSASIKGKWLPAIARNDVQRGTIKLSEDLSPTQKDIFGLDDEVTIIRYPVTGYQSYLTLKVDYDEKVPNGLAIINSDDAKYLALDGDDHILVTKPFSEFTGNEPVNSARAEERKLDLSKMSLMEIYTSPAKAEALLGVCFNQMIKAKSQNEEALAKVLGEELDILAQAVKKPYRLNMAILMKKLSPVGSEANILVGKVEAAYQMAKCLPKAVVEPQPEIYKVADEEKLQKFLKILEVKAAQLNQHQYYVALVKASSAAKAEIIKAKSLEEFKELAVAYYEAASILKVKGSPISDYLSGEILAAGYIAAKEKYSPLFT